MCKNISFYIFLLLLQYKEEKDSIISLPLQECMQFSPNAFHKGCMIEWPSKFLVIFLLSATSGSADKTTQDDEYGVLGSYISCDHIDQTQILLQRLAALHSYYITTVNFPEDTLTFFNQGIIWKTWRWSFLTTSKLKNLPLHGKIPSVGSS